MKKSTTSILLIAILVACGLIYWLFSNVTQLEYIQKPKKVEAYAAPNTSGLNNLAKLNEHTGILGYAVYDANGQILGTLYDVYAEPENGKVLWISVNVKNSEIEHTKSELKVVPLTDIASMTDNGPVTLRMNQGAFSNLPPQTTHEKHLTGLISLRSLPTNRISNDLGQKIGQVKKVTYRKGYLETLYFTVDGSPLQSKDQQLFSMPFNAFNFDLSYDQFTGNPEIGLTSRQTGAVEMYMHNENRLQ